MSRFAALDPDCNGALVVLGHDLAAIDRVRIFLPRPGPARQERFRLLLAALREVHSVWGPLIVGVENALIGRDAGNIRGALWGLACVTQSEVVDLPVQSRGGWHVTGRVRVRGISNPEERAVAEARTTIAIREYAYPEEWGAARDLDAGTAQALCMARWLATRRTA